MTAASETLFKRVLSSGSMFPESNSYVIGCALPHHYCEVYSYSVWKAVDDWRIRR